MGLFRSVRAVTDASTGVGQVDWVAVGEAARSATTAGTLDRTAVERAYAGDVRDARDRVRSVTGVDFDLPRTVEVQTRHHWIDANVDTFERVMAPLEDRVGGPLPGVVRVANTGTMAAMLAYLARHVLGQYDPLLLADDEPHGLYFVDPNVRRVATALGVGEARFRRWIVFHEVTHAAEFGAAPWLSAHLEERLERSIEALSAGRIDPEAFADLDAAMTAVEGYAELVMDRAFDEEYADLRERLDERRRGRGPVARLARRLLGLGLKRRQYERGRHFFETVVDRAGMATASRVWERPEALPTSGELDDPERWLRRV